MTQLQTRIMRPTEWARPIVPVQREVISSRPHTEDERAPVLFVPGFGHGAWAYEEHWLERTAARGFPAHAMSLRGHGASGSASATTIRAYVHDVVQVAAGLPQRSILVGHGAGALVVAHALARYPARAAVLIAPIFGGWRTLGTSLLRNPFGTIPAAFGGRVKVRRGQLFGPNLHSSAARAYMTRIGSVPTKVQRELLSYGTPEAPVGDPSVLVVGSPDDKIVSQQALRRVATTYGGAPLLFPGMGHDMMLDAGWAEPIDAILDWLSKAD
jgi:pimeloyl-ACP methyl ester carboxylesterase